MLKMAVIFGLFVLLTALIWALGLRGDEEAILKYLVFSAQLLYGNLLYDLLKSLRPIPSNDCFWSSVSKVAGEATAWMLAALFLLFLTAKVLSIPYVGLIGALIAYGFIFARVLPKLHPLYVQAQNRVQKTAL